LGTPAAQDRFPAMTVSLPQLLEDSFQIAWEYLERTGEPGGGAIASRFLNDTVETMIRPGQRQARAVQPAAYQRFRMNVATSSKLSVQVWLNKASLN
jgi:hypothetical protein